jgi:two-component system OmpR family sensor kinase
VILRALASIRVRLALAFTLLVGAILIMIGTVTYQLLRDSLLTQIERDVAVRAEAFASGDVAPPYELDTFGAPDVFLQVTDGAGTPVARSGNLEGRTLPTPESARDGTVVEVHVADRPLFLTTAPPSSTPRNPAPSE